MSSTRTSAIRRSTSRGCAPPHRRWRAVKHEPAPANWLRYGQEVKRGLQAADHVIAPTQAMLGRLQHYYGPLPPTRVIPNGRTAWMFPTAPKEPFVFSAGRLWDEAKNIATLAAAAPHVSWPIYVAGDDRHPDGGQSRHDGVRLLGRLSPHDVAGWLATASIYALPARYEPFGLSALEAALAGCALVLGDIPSLREVWGDAAIFVPPEDADVLARQLNRLISNDTLRHDLSASVRPRAAIYPSSHGSGILSRISGPGNRCAAAPGMPGHHDKGLPWSISSA